MEFLSNKLITLDYRRSLQRDLGQAKVCRFLVAYVSSGGIDSINRPVLINALRDPRSFGVASLSCSCKYEPLLRVQDDLTDVRLKYFMDPIVAESGEPSGIALFHSKLVYLYLPRQNKSVIYLGSHNWTRRALGPQGPRNAEASMRLEFNFEEDHLTGEGSSIASEVNQHLLSAWGAPLCLPAIRSNEETFEEWCSKACGGKASTIPMESNVVVLAVRKGTGPADWASLAGSSIYMQILNEPEGELVGSKYMKQLLVMVWKGEADLQAGRQPVLLFCKVSSGIAGARSSVGGTNQARDPIQGFAAVIFDEDELASRAEQESEQRSSVSLWSGRNVEVYDFEFPAPHPGCEQVDRGVEPNHRYLLEVDSIVMPADGVIPPDAEMCWTADSLAMAKSKTSTKVEKSPGYYVDSETEQAMVHCLEELLLVDLEQAKVRPYSDVDRAKIGKRVSQHPLHETFLGSQLTEPGHRDAYYAEAKESAFIAELDAGDDESLDSKDELKRLQRVYTSPVAELRQGWRKHAEALRPKEKEAKPDRTKDDPQPRLDFDE